MKKLLFILFAITIAFSSCKFVKKKGWFGLEETDTLAAYQRKQDSLHRVDSIQKALARKKAIEKARQDSIKKAEQARLEELAKFRYHIIVGSFLTPEYADEWSAYYNSLGYGTEILEAGNGFNLVSARKYDNMSNALFDLERFKDTVQVDAWVYVNE